MPEPIAKPSATNTTPYSDSTEASTSIDLVLSLKVNHRLLRRQKRVLFAMGKSLQLAPAQEEAVDGLLNLIDFIQDSIVDQGLASEQEVFPQMHLPFEIAA